MLLGCLYVDPTDIDGADAEVSWWVVHDLVGTDVEAALDDLVATWIAGVALGAAGRGWPGGVLVRVAPALPAPHDG